MKHYKFNPDEFLDFVHDIDLSKLKKSSSLFEKIQSLPGTKLFIQTVKKLCKKRVLDSLGISDLFESIWDIKKSQFIPKPQINPLKDLIKENNFDISSCVYFEDIKKNLEPAHKLGITTIHITSDKSFKKDSYIDFRFKTIISIIWI